MGKDMKVFLELDANAAKMKEGVRQGEQALTGFRGVVKGLKNDLEYATSKIGVLGTAAAALSTGLVAKRLFSIKDFMPIDDSLVTIRHRLSATAGEMDYLRSKIAATAGEGHNMEALFKSAEKLTYLGTPKGVLSVLSSSAMVSKAMREDLTLTTETMSRLMKIYGIPTDKVDSVAKKLIASRLDLETLNVLVQRNVTKGGAKNLESFLALVGGLKKAGIDSSRGAGKLIEMINQLETKTDTLQRSGIKVFETDPETGKKTKRDDADIINDLKEKVAHYRALGWSEEKLATALNKLAPGLLETLDYVEKAGAKIKKTQEDMGNAGVITAKRLAEANDKWSTQLDKVKGHLDAVKVRFAWIYDIAKKPLKIVADSPNLVQGAALTAGGISAAILAGLAYFKGKDFLKNLPGGGAGSAAKSIISSDFLKSRAEMAGRLAEFKLVDTGAKTMGVGLVPVYVVNWPAGGIATGMDMASKGSKGLEKAGDIATGAAAAKTLEKLSATRMVLEKLKTWGGAAWRGAGGLMMKYTPLFLPRQVILPAAAGYGAGWALNQGSGAIAGLMSSGKYHGSGWLGEMIYDSIHREDVIKNAIAGMKPPEVKNDIEINLRIDQNGSIIGDTGNLNTDVRINLDRGMF
ncbi:MAG: hypothetical protein NTV58_12315 [Deltaproteobacteria bacterium]|nr:hypothetical protein [Deltaproteobacteria bacterium]